MTRSPGSGTRPAHDLIVDRIYEIALEPAAFADFIDLWHEHDLEAELDLAGGPERDHVFKRHFERAAAILNRDESQGPDLGEYLSAYEGLAALVVGGALLVEAANPGAQSVFDAREGARVDGLRLPEEIRAALGLAVKGVLLREPGAERLIKADLSDKGGSLLFRVTKLSAKSRGGGPVALIVSNRFHWRDSIGKLLGSVFRLTAAEQDIVRLLIEGHDTKSIAASRKTSEGTVRGQIKAILAKLNLRSQADIARLVMTLGDFQKEGPSDRAPLPSGQGWLKAEVWKPFATATMPDGAALQYHEMGPATGNPVLLSHMGSAMVRWPEPMVRMAYELNLRVICPIRRGYGHSSGLKADADPLATASADAVALLSQLRIGRLPYVVLGTDFAFAVDLFARHPGALSGVIALGGRPQLPGGAELLGQGRWQRFFVTTARTAPHFVQFAAQAVMAMCKRIGPEAMLRQLCKESAADMALLEDPVMRDVLAANLSLMAGKSTNAGRAFSSEFIRFQEDWSGPVAAMEGLPMQVFLADEDPTLDLAAVPKLCAAYPWIEVEVLTGAGLALLYQKYQTLLPRIAEAAAKAARG
ncbi:MAG: LuxR C-terminal-related transcriptional regulator [Pseudomonadota bacterium]